MKRAAADTAPVVVDLTGEDEDEEVVERPAQGRQDRRERKRHAAGAAAAAAVEVVELLDDEEPGESEALHECKICFDEVPVSRTVLLSACGHRFCVTCSGMHVKAKILEGQVRFSARAPAVLLTHVGMCLRGLQSRDRIHEMRGRLRRSPALLSGLSGRSSLSTFSRPGWGRPQVPGGRPEAVRDVHRARGRAAVPRRGRRPGGALPATL